MVGGRSWRRELLYYFAEGDLLRLYTLVVRNGGAVRITLSRRFAVADIVRRLAKTGIGKTGIVQRLKQIGVRPEEHHRMILRVSRAPEKVALPHGHLNAVRFFGSPEEVYKRCAEHSISYTAKKQQVEYMIVEKLAEAGWNSRKIWKATGFNRRRIQRIIRKTKENDAN